MGFNMKVTPEIEVPQKFAKKTVKWMYLFMENMM